MRARDWRMFPKEFASERLAVYIWSIGLPSRELSVFLFSHSLTSLFFLIVSNFLYFLLLSSAGRILSFVHSRRHGKPCYNQSIFSDSSLALAAIWGSLTFCLFVWHVVAALVLFGVIPADRFKYKVHIVVSVPYHKLRVILRFLPLHPDIQRYKISKTAGEAIIPVSTFSVACSGWTRAPCDSCRSA